MLSLHMRKRRVVAKKRTITRWVALAPVFYSGGPAETRVDRGLQMVQAELKLSSRSKNASFLSLQTLAVKQLNCQSVASTWGKRSSRIQLKGL